MTRASLRQLTVWWPALTMHVAMGSMFLCLAILLGALSGVVGGFTWVLVWPALSLVVVGLGYVWLGPWVLGKQADGPTRRQFRPVRRRQSRRRNEISTGTPSRYPA